MNGLIKDDLTVALDEVDRTASRIVTIYDDLAAIAIDPDVAQGLRSRGDRHRQALVKFNHARRAAGHTPETGDPERAHLQSLWLAMKSAVVGENSEHGLTQSLRQLDEELHAAVDTALSLQPELTLREALERLAAQAEGPTM